MFFCNRCKACNIWHKHVSSIWCISLAVHHQTISSPLSCTTSLTSMVLWLLKLPEQHTRPFVAYKYAEWKGVVGYKITLYTHLSKWNLCTMSAHPDSLASTHGWNSIVSQSQNCAESIVGRNLLKTLWVVGHPPRTAYNHTADIHTAYSQVAGAQVLFKWLQYTVELIL